MRRELLFAALVALAATSVALALPADVSGPVSVYGWADAQHGWGSNAPACRPPADLCSTEDGGRTWHGIFEGGTFVFANVRTSARVGFVSTGRTESAEFWTRDNGRHWYRTEQVRGYTRGSGRYLFWLEHRRELGDLVHQVTSWPPREPVRCRRWARGAFDEPYGTRPSGPFSVCVDGAREAGMRSGVVFRLPPGQNFDRLHDVPGGIAGLVQGPATRSLFLRRLETNRLVTLPPPPARLPPDFLGRSSTLLVSWPHIFLAELAPSARAHPVVVLHSADGGETWQAPSTSAKAASWFDSQFGWTEAGAGVRCGRAALCSTNNGGATWRPIFSRGPIASVARTSPRAGIVGLDRPGVPRYWTNDAGRHWYPTRRIGRGFAGNANLLFWRRGRVLYRVPQWPPRAGRRAVPASRIVARLRAGRFVDLVIIPGGVAALVTYEGEPDRLAVLVHRLGRNRLTTLPRVQRPAGTASLRLAGSLSAPALHFAQSPGLAVAATAYDRNRQAIGEIVWYSPDAGSTWSTNVLP
jgi:hypothetical protein